MAGRIVPATETGIAAAARLLRAGELVAFPTETVYGLGGDATNERAVARDLRGQGPAALQSADRARARLAEAERLAVFDDARRARRRRVLAGAADPGVAAARRTAALSLLASAGLDTVALRVPAHPVAQALLRAAGRPVAAPSANRSGRVSPTTAAHVAAELGDRVGADPRWRALPDRHRIDRARPDRRERRCCCAPAASPSKQLRRRARAPIAAADRPTRAALPRAARRAITRRACRCGSTRRRPGRARRCSPSGRRRRPASPRCCGSAATAISPRRRPTCSRCCARLDRPDFTGIAVMPIPGARARPRDQRPAAPRRRAALVVQNLDTRHPAAYGRKPTPKPTGSAGPAGDAAHKMFLQRHRRALLKQHGRCGEWHQGGERTASLRLQPQALRYKPRRSRAQAAAPSQPLGQAGVFLSPGYAARRRHRHARSRPRTRLAICQRTS